MAYYSGLGNLLNTYRASRDGNGITVASLDEMNRIDRIEGRGPYGESVYYGSGNAIAGITAAMVASRLQSSIDPGPIELDAPPIPATAGPSPEYREKLRKVGATALLNKLNADEEIQAFQALVVEHGLRFYDMARVEAYLINEAKMHSGKPLDAYGNTWRMQVNWKPLEQYMLAIPSPVLETIERVYDAHPAAAFFISEVKEYPDPFLMVQLHGNQFIIEKWDEPAYREE